MKEKQRKYGIVRILTVALTILGVNISVSQAGVFEVGSKFSYIKYEEPNVMEESGMMYGFFGKYILGSQENQKVSSWNDFISNYGSNYMVSLGVDFSLGQLDYDSQSTGSIDDIDNFIFEIRTITGYDFSILEQTTITPYVGFGYRYLIDASGGKLSTTGHSGYDRESQYFYLPFGFQTSTVFNDQWSWGVSLEYDLFIDGTQKSHLEDVSSALSMLENDQNDGYGIRGSLKFARESEVFDFIFEPYINFWDIDDSTINVSCGVSLCIAGYEPKNESMEYGAKIGMKF